MYNTNKQSAHINVQSTNAGEETIKGKEYKSFEYQGKTNYRLTVQYPAEKSETDEEIVRELKETLLSLIVGKKEDVQNG